MRKIIAVTVLILLLLPCTAFAGDTDYWIKIGDQDAFIIGKVTNFKDNLYSVHVKKVLMGEMESTDIKVEKPDYISSGHLVVGNIIVTSLDKKGTVYKIKHGVFRVNSTNFKTLRLDYASNNSINARIQKFINSGSFIEADRKAKEKKGKTNNNEVGKDSCSIVYSNMNKGPEINPVKFQQIKAQVYLFKQVLDEFGATSPSEAVELWAKSESKRNGVYQYAVSCDELKQKIIEKWGKAEENFWIIGGSSPSTDKYEIVKNDKINDNTYIVKIKFYWSSSLGEEEPTYNTLTIVKGKKYWCVNDYK